MEQVQTTLHTRIITCNLFILSYIVFSVYALREKLEPMIVGFLFVLFLSVFGISYILKGFASLPLSLNVYTEFGYDPTESKQQWYFIIPIAMLVLWIFVRYFS